MKKLILFVLPLALLLVTACQAASPTPTPTPAPTIVVSPTPVPILLLRGEKLTLERSETLQTAVIDMGENGIDVYTITSDYDAGVTRKWQIAFPLAACSINCWHTNLEGLRLQSAGESLFVYVPENWHIK